MTSEQLAWLIRRHGVEMTHLSGGSHIASILSVADIIAVLYSDVLRYDPQDPKMPERDRFILDYLPESVVLAGAKKSKQVQSNAEAMDWHLTEEQMRVLREISADEN